VRFVFDLDGTICFDGRRVSGRIGQSLDRLIAAGHEVIFASARPVRDMVPVLDGRFRHLPLIGGNGSLIATNGNVVHAETFTPEQLDRIREWIREHRASVLLDGEWDYAFAGPVNDHPVLQRIDALGLARRLSAEELRASGRIVKMLVVAADRMELLAERIAGLNVAVHWHREEDAFDVNPPGIDKWRGLQRLGVPERSYVCFGNDANDIGMFRHALHAVMVGRHPGLAPYAAESVPAGADADRRVADRIAELGVMFHPSAKAGNG